MAMFNRKQFVYQRVSEFFGRFLRVLSHHWMVPAKRENRGILWMVDVDSPPLYFQRSLDLSTNRPRKKTLW